MEENEDAQGAVRDWSDIGPDLDWLIANTPLAAAEFHKQVECSQTRARELHASGEPLPYLILADQIPKAHGRRNRPYWAGFGSLAMTLLWRPEEANNDPSLPSLVSLSTALAVIEFAEFVGAGEFVPGRDLAFHWPNDVYLRGRKLSGILTERLADGTFALGIGINVNNSVATAPEELRDRITSLCDELAVMLPRELLLLDFIRRFFAMVELLEEPRDPESGQSGREVVIQRANELCFQVGRRISVQIGERTDTGECVRIDAHGGLVLDGPEGHKTFHSGEVTATSAP